MNLPKMGHMHMEIKDNRMGILLVVLACLGQHGVAQYKGLVVRLDEKVCNIFVAKNNLLWYYSVP
jgi:hypothetical protein